MDRTELTQYIKSEAARLGFDICAIAEAKAVDESIQEGYTNWINEARHGTMQYLERNCDNVLIQLCLLRGGVVL